MTPPDKHAVGVERASTGTLGTTDCPRVTYLEQILEKARAHVQANKCTQCATAILDAVPAVIETAQQMLLDIDLKRSELEADRLRQHKADPEHKRLREQVGPELKPKTNSGGF